MAQEQNPEALEYIEMITAEIKAESKLTGRESFPPRRAYEPALEAWEDPSDALEEEIMETIRKIQNAPSHVGVFLEEKAYLKGQGLRWSVYHIAADYRLSSHETEVAAEAACAYYDKAERDYQIAMITNGDHPDAGEE